ncbi:trypsin-like serine peptidase [Photobacterium damselae]|uniref:trypsin-like serine peptidase n=1 Tax=Photobacterium damselae TaxID=38293 RepID=UPI002F3EC7AE
MKKIILCTFFIFSLPASAIVINEEVFKDNGGDVNNVPQSIKYANNDLREKSFSNEFLAVGVLPTCTATWIGNDTKGWSYILTAAHCVSYKDTVNEVWSRFTSWNGRVIAEGNGYSYVPQERINGRGASTDIAILQLPTVDILVDKAGNPVPKPVLYDGEQEFGNTVSFVGYGIWGVGFNGSGGYRPENGPRRLYGESIIDSIFEQNRGIGATYHPTGHSKKWARIASGDSGSAWWQEHKGVNTIIATTNGGHARMSTGARVSKYIDWIRSIYTDARLLSNELLHWGKNFGNGVVGDYYKAGDPDTGELIIYRLDRTNNGFYGYFPKGKQNNYYWTYVGPRNWTRGEKGKIGDLYLADINRDDVLLRLRSVNASGYYWYYPTEKVNNRNWEFINTLNK